MDVAVRDDLVQVGLTEDGEPDVAHRFYLVARDARGAQWAHDYARVAGRGGIAADVAAAALEVLRVRVAAHLEAGGALDFDHWIEIDPAYGSEAYQALDAAGYFWAQEIVAAADGGEAVSGVLEAEARRVVDAFAT
jgi:hypothetical protein